MRNRGNLWKSRFPPLIGLAVFFFLNASALAVSSIEFPLVKDGKPLANVLVGGNEPVLNAAVQDLREYVQQMSGAILEIATGEMDLPGPTLHLDQTQYFAKLEPPRQKIKLDGFIAARQGEDLLLTGNLPQGTANAIVTMLQDQFGIRWYYSGSLWEIVPESKDLVIRVQSNVDENTYLENPSYLGRSLWGKHGTDDFSRHSRLTQPGVKVPYAGTSHNLNAAVPPKKYFDSHPEYYALVNGQRSTDHPCFTHPDIPSIIMEYIRNGGRGLGVNDNCTVCRCERCLEVDGKSKPYNGMTNASESYFQLIKKLGEQTAKEFPDERLGVFAYQITNAPPKTVKHIGENVDVVLCQDTAQYFDPEYRKIDMDMSAEWVRKCGGVRMYDYIGINFWTPRYFPHILSDQLKHMARAGVKGYGTHCSSMIDSCMPMYYLYYQMLWNAELDPDDLINTMMDDLYVESAGPMRKFYQHWEDAWERQKKGKWFFGMDNFMGEMEIYTPEDFQKGERLLREAAALARNEYVQKRIDFIQKRFAYTLAAANAYYTSMKALKSAPKAKSEDAIALSNDVVSAWKVYAEELDRARKLEGIVPNGWLDKTFRVRAWGLKQQMRDAALAPAVKWICANESRMDPVSLRHVEQEMAMKVVKNRQEIETLVADEIGASTRMPRADGLMTAEIPPISKASYSLTARESDWVGISHIRSTAWVFRARPENQETGRYDEPIIQNIVDAPSQEDQSITWQAAWDRKNLYVRLVVRDDKHEQGNPPEGMWKQDSVQIGLTPNRDVFDYREHSWEYIWGGYRPEDAELGISLHDGKADVHVWKVPKSLEKKDVNSLIQASAARHGDKTVYEAAIDWNLIPGFQPKAKASFGICVTVNDSDNGVRRSAEYGSGIAHSKRPTEFAALRLAK